MAEDIALWLDSLGLGQYAQAFTDNGIDIESLPHLRDEDFERLGVLLGHTRRLQAAIETLSRPLQWGIIAPAFSVDVVTQAGPVAVVQGRKMQSAVGLRARRDGQNGVPEARLVSAARRIFLSS